MRRKWLAGALWIGLIGCSTEAVGGLADAGRPTEVACVADEDCDDGLICSGLERCLDGRCWSGRPPVCSDGDPCTRDLCLEPRGCSFVLMCGDAQAVLPEAGGASLRDAGADAAVADADTADAASYTPRIPAYCSAANTLIGDVSASTQATLETLIGVACIDGDLRITGAEVETLAALASLRWLGGSLSVAATPTLESLQGLDETHFTLHLGFGLLLKIVDVEIMN